MDLLAAWGARGGMVAGRSEGGSLTRRKATWRCGENYDAVRGKGDLSEMVPGKG